MDSIARKSADILGRDRPPKSNAAMSISSRLHKKICNHPLIFRQHEWFQDGPGPTLKRQLALDLPLKRQPFFFDQLDITR